MYGIIHNDSMLKALCGKKSPEEAADVGSLKIAFDEIEQLFEEEKKEQAEKAIVNSATKDACKNVVEVPTEDDKAMDELVKVMKQSGVSQQAIDKLP